MNQAHSTGDRVRDVRKRRGLTQRALAESSGVSLSLIKKLEQGDYGDVRLETLHKLAITLRVPTTTLATQPDAEEPEGEDVRQWAPVRRALEGTSAGDEPAEEPTLGGLKDAVSVSGTPVTSSARSSSTAGPSHPRCATSPTSFTWPYSTA
jgi:transcriptional regulator with XRE-family HTH domain